MTPSCKQNYLYAYWSSRRAVYVNPTTQTVSSRSAEESVSRTLGRRLDAWRQHSNHRGARDAHASLGRVWRGQFPPHRPESCCVGEPPRRRYRFQTLRSARSAKRPRNERARCRDSHPLPPSVTLDAELRRLKEAEDENPYNV